ncbi:hypothetical protein MFIFM68171_08784 [Madurella fahalii]|uniref:Cytochrome P450 n=1 Tax=Madurella fahalii TaxID=1157608 RepID=A0ABQ0GLD8_9PEZI
MPMQTDARGKFDDPRRGVALLPFRKAPNDGQPVQAPQGPAGLPPVGSYYEVFPEHLGNHYRLFRKYGHVIKTANMDKTIYWADSPDVALVALSESTYFTKINEDYPLWGVKDTQPSSSAKLRMRTGG